MLVEIAKSLGLFFLAACFIVAGAKLAAEGTSSLAEIIFAMIAFLVGISLVIAALFIGLPFVIPIVITFLFLAAVFAVTVLFSLRGERKQA